MIEKYFNATNFSNTEEFAKGFHIHVPDNFNFAYDIVDEWAAKAPNKRALCWVNEHGRHHDFTFGEMKQLSDAAASFFQSIGIGRGDMVMLMLKRRYEFWIAILGLHKIGAVAIPATHLLTPKDIEYRCNAADICAIICTEEHEMQDKINAAIPLCPTVKHRIAIDAPEDGWHDFHRGLQEAAPFMRPSTPVNSNDDIMLLYFTSGTTGNPKMVTHNFAYPLGHIVTAKYWQQLHEASLHLTVADTGWAKVAWGKLYGQWIIGAAIFVYDHERFDAATMLRLIQDYRITSFCAPPTVYRFMVLEDLSSYDLSALEHATTAGEALNPSVFEAFQKGTGLKMTEAFGQTETTPLIVTFPWVEPRPGSMGIPNPIYNLDIIRPDGSSAGVGEKGEIVIRMPEDGSHPLGLFRGYYRDEAMTQQVLHDGLYHTCDVAYRDEDGYCWFVGRTDDIIKSSGYRIGPFEVESAVMTHPSVVECAITGVPDDIRGMVVKATIVLAPEYKEKAGPDLVREIQQHVKRVTAPYKYPRLIEFVDALPKTISGKIRRVEIRQNEQ
jgi:dicarboxylate-coA ligase pimA